MFKTVKPFIKWAGGKSQILNVIREKYPDKIERYCEPFAGGGAVLFDILENVKPKEVLINDINYELVNTYIQVKTNVEKLIINLKEIQEIFWKADKETQKEIYYKKRERFNSIININNENLNLEKAVLFIFLNKTCFNGLYRVNKKGEFNVPIGPYKKTVICDEDSLNTAARLLHNVQIQNGDYSKCTGFIDANTFVYIDPPYRPLSSTSSFNSYTEYKFDDNKQKELLKFVDVISEKGAKVLG